MTTMNAHCTRKQDNVLYHSYFGLSNYFMFNVLKLVFFFLPQYIFLSLQLFCISFWCVL